MAKQKIAINGFGRIGKLTFRELICSDKVDVIAINASRTPEEIAHSIQYDSAQGQFMIGKVKTGEDFVEVDGKKVKLVSIRDPKQLPWKELNVDVVVESTGVFRKKEDAQLHIEAGAKKVIITAPGSGEMPTIVYGVNHETLKSEDTVVSGASCTTNCLAPIANVLDKEFGIVKGFMTTIHAYTNDQRILDGTHSDPRRARAGAVNIIPTTTGAAVAVGKVLPQLAGKLDGMAMRVPTITGSVVDLVVELKENVSAEQVNQAVKKAASQTIGYSELPLVSSDVIGTNFGTIFDAPLTSILEVDGKQMVKVIMWYDNEYSYVSQLVRTTEHLASL